MTPPKVLGTPNPESSVIISKMFGAFCGGTTFGGHQGVEFRASFLISPPNSGTGGGSCSPLRVMVASGAPEVPCTVPVRAGMAVQAASTRTAMRAINTTITFGFTSYSFP